MIIGTLFFLVAACGEAPDVAQTARLAQHQADQRIASAKAEADQTSRDAQAAADVQVAAADATMRATAEAYRHEITTRLVGLDETIAGLEARALRANGADRKERLARLVSIRGHRADFTRECDSLDGTSGDAWHAARSRVDKAWTDLKAEVEAV